MLSHPVDVIHLSSSWKRLISVGYYGPVLVLPLTLSIFSFTFSSASLFLILPIFHLPILHLSFPLFLYFPLCFNSLSFSLSFSFSLSLSLSRALSLSLSPSSVIVSPMALSSEGCSAAGSGHSGPNYSFATMNGLWLCPDNTSFSPLKERKTQNQKA